MISKELKESLEKQHYRLSGKHSAIKICEWTKKSMIDKGVCFKEKFYGIKSHRCCQISPTVVFCENKCLHCWRAIELSCGDTMEDIETKDLDKPEEIIKGSNEYQKKLLMGFKGNPKVNSKKFKDAMEPMQFAISLTGEPTLYPYIGELIDSLRKKGKTSFIVTNGLQPKVLEKLNKKKQLPTQLYISLNTPNKEMYNKWHRSSKKNAWNIFNKSLKIFPKLKTRTVVRLTIVKGLNDDPKYIKEFSKLINIAKPDFIEVKSYMAIGYSRYRLGYEKMLSHKEIKDYSKLLTKELKSGYKILDDHKLSRVVLIGKDKRKMKIQKKEI